MKAGIAGRASKLLSMKTRRALLSLALGVALITTSADAPVQAGSDFAKPPLDQFYWANLTVEPGDQLRWNCDYDWEGSNLAIYAAMRIVATQTTEVVLWGFINREDGSVWLRVGDVTQKVDYFHEDRGSIRFSQPLVNTTFSEAAGIRSAWASWGKGQSCGLSRNGQSISPQLGDPSRASWLVATDFDGPVGISGPNAGAGALAGHRHSADGFIFVLFENYLGRARAEGPSGERYESRPGTPFASACNPVCQPISPSPIMIFRESSGEWNFHLDVSAGHAPDVPMLWILETPI